MVVDEVVEIFLCSRCLIAESEPGVCTRCDLQLIVCRPGAEDDPHRRPLMDAQGNVLSPAPLWWLKHTLGSLAMRFEENSTED